MAGTHTREPPAEAVHRGKSNRNGRDTHKRAAIRGVHRGKSNHNGRDTHKRALPQSATVDREAPLQDALLYLCHCDFHSIGGSAAALAAMEALLLLLPHWTPSGGSFLGVSLLSINISESFSKKQSVYSSLWKPGKAKAKLSVNITESLSKNKALTLLSWPSTPPSTSSKPEANETIKQTNQPTHTRQTNKTKTPVKSLRGFFLLCRRARQVIAVAN